MKDRMGGCESVEADLGAGDDSREGVTGWREGAFEMEGGEGGEGGEGLDGCVLERRKERGVTLRFTRLKGDRQTYEVWPENIRVPSRTDSKAGELRSERVERSDDSRFDGETLWGEEAKIHESPSIYDRLVSTERRRLPW